MHQLLLLRHAKSAQGDASLADHARTLNACGREAAAAIGAALRGLGLAPNIVLVSSALRARQTLAALEPWDDTPLIEVLDPLYLAPVPRLLSILQSVAETARSVLVIGHNPGLQDLAIFLAGEQAVLGEDPPARALAEGFPTATLAEFAIPGAWHTLQPSCARLLRLLRPRDLPGRL
ncbi:MAG: histidine phosphatase family protein [Acetobacteraceae bacterium]|nr:histidine phosphatase family protein [Acetobacteraceae bacterium]